MEIEQLTAESLFNEAYLGYRIGDGIFQPKWCNWQAQGPQDLGYIYTYTAQQFSDSLAGELFQKFAENSYEIKSEDCEFGPISNRYHKATV